MDELMIAACITASLAALAGLAFGSHNTGREEATEAAAKAIGDTYLRARNEAKLSLLDEIFSPDVVVHDPSRPEGIVGLAALKEQYSCTHAAVPNVRFTLDDVYLKGDRIVSIFTMSGTIERPFRTPMGELPPTGRSFRFSGVAIDRLAEGKIVEEWVHYNVLDILQPLGFTLVPPSPPQVEVKQA